MGDTTRNLPFLLGGDSVTAEHQCAEIWRDLVRYLRWQNHPYPEDGAQEAFSRGWARATGEDAPPFERPEDLRSYFFGFAWCVAREGWRPPKEEPIGGEWELSNQPCTSENIEAKVFLDELMSQIGPDERELLIRYHLEDRGQLAASLGIPRGTLRVQVHRICQKLTRIAGRGTV